TGAVLGGTTTVNAVNGVATFSNLSLNAVGAGYTLQASTPGLASATSTSIAVTANTLQVLTQPTSVAQNSGFDLSVEVLDASSNVVTGFTGPVTLTIATGPSGAAIGGTTT